MANKPAPTNPENIDKKIIETFLENQKQQALNEANEIKFKEKQLAYDSEYAKDLLAKQHDLLKNNGRENRSNFLVYAGAALVFILIICVLILWLLYMEKDKVVDTILTWGGRIAALTVSFILGRLSALKSMKDKPDDATQVVDP